MTFDVSTVLVVISAIILCGILADKFWIEAQAHFSASEQCSKGIDHQGNERNYWSFHSYRRNTVIGNTIGRACIAFASWQFHRRHQDTSPLIRSADDLHG